jgi:outer membrane protein assembly factor BamB
MREVLVAMDAATGQELWRVDFPKQFGSPVPDFGAVSSPLVHGPHLYIQAGSGLIKLNKVTGEVLWRMVDEGGGKSKNGAFSSVGWRN